MELKTLPEIRSYIENWNKIRSSADDLKKYLANATSFSYKIGTKPSDYFHVYPGICPDTRTMYMFLIDSSQDVSKKFDTIIQCQVTTDLGNSEPPLPSKEALDMIYNWQNNKDTWIDKKINTKYGIFRAFSMPAAYMEEDTEYETFFSLKPKIKADENDDTEYEADLVTMKKNFYDVVRPVPPFGGGVEESDFNL